MLWECSHIRQGGLSTYMHEDHSEEAREELKPRSRRGPPPSYTPDTRRTAEMGVISVCLHHRSVSAEAFTGQLEAQSGGGSAPGGGGSAFKVLVIQRSRFSAASPPTPVGCFTFRDAPGIGALLYIGKRCNDGFVSSPVRPCFLHHSPGFGRLCRGRYGFLFAVPFLVSYLLVG